MRIKKYLESNSMTKPAFAKLIGISVSTLEKYLYSNRIPSLQMAHTIVLKTNGEIQYVDMLKQGTKKLKKSNIKLDKWNEL